MKRIQIYILFFILLIFSAGCKKEKAEWDIDVLGPILKTQLNLEDFIPDSMLGTYTDSSVLLVLDKELYRIDFDSIFDSPQGISNFSFAMPFQMNIPPGSTVITKTETKKFDFGDAEISHCIINQGKITIRCENPYDEYLLFKYEIPSATRNGQIFSITESIPPLTIGSNIYEKSYDFDSYSLDMTANSNHVNRIITKYIIKTPPDGDTVLFTTTDSIRVKVNFKELEIGYIKGYFGNGTYTTEEETTTIDIFDIIKSGTLNIEAINAKLIIENGLGIDAKIKLNSFISTNTTTANSIPLTGSFIGQTQNISRAQFNGFCAYPTVTPWVKEIDLNGSNIIPFLENFPDEFTYNMDFEYNPLENISAGNDFMHYSETFKASIYAEIPMSFTANNLVLADYTDISISGDSSIIERNCNGIVKLYAQNMFPLEGDVQIYLLDQSNNIVDSIFTTPHIIQAATDFSGERIQSPQQSIITAGVDTDKIRLIYNTEKAYVKIRFNTPTSSFVKIFPEYYIDIQLIADFNMLVY